MSDKPKIWKWIKEVFSFLGSLYAFFLLLGIIASIIPQILPVFFNPLVVEGAKYVTVILISFLGSYFLLKRSEKKRDDFKGALSETEKKMDELNVKMENQERKYKDLYNEVGKFIDDVSKLNALNLKNQQTLSALGERLDKFFFIKCPICNKRIDLNIPNTIISGIHEVDGRASDSTSRDTKELDLQCPQCRRKFHIDIPHSELIKI